MKKLVLAALTSLALSGCFGGTHVVHHVVPGPMVVGHPYGYGGMYHTPVVVHHHVVHHVVVHQRPVTRVYRSGNRRR